MWLATLADIGVWLKQRLNRVVVSQEMFQKPSPVTSVSWWQEKVIKVAEGSWLAV
jgi:hypothetical protein